MTRHNRDDLQGRLDALEARLAAFTARVEGEPVPSRSAAIAAANHVAHERDVAAQKLRAAGGLDDRASAEIMEAVAILLDDLEESLTDEEAIRTSAARHSSAGRTKE